MTKAFSVWLAKIKTLNARGLDDPPFAALLIGPLVAIDVDGDDPPRELRETSEAEIVRRTLEQPKS